LDTIQAVIARHILSNKLDLITKTRIQNAKYYDEKLGSLSEVVIPPRESESKHVYHIYSILCEKRDELVDYLIANGVDAKIHYPTPMHLQPAARAYGYCKGDFPVAERICCHTISLPVHEFITRDEQDTVIRLIEKFYGKP
jgi:dTDP-4-amino-4,6-dideoxygalactose transaminase